MQVVGTGKRISGKLSYGSIQDAQGLCNLLLMTADVSVSLDVSMINVRDSTCEVSCSKALLEPAKSECSQGFASLWEM